VTLPSGDESVLPLFSEIRRNVELIAIRVRTESKKINTNLGFAFKVETISGSYLKLLNHASLSFTVILSRTLRFNIIVEIYLVRHGETALIRKRIVMGRMSGIPLTEEGRDSVEGISRYFRGKNIDKVYTSPLERTLETCLIISKAVGVKPIKEAGFIETNYGEWTGLEFSEIQSKYSSKWKKWEETPADFKVPGGESLLDVQKRAMEAFYKIVSDSKPHTKVIVVSHVDVIKSLILEILGAPLSLRGKFDVGLASISKVVSDPKRNYRVSFINNKPS